MYRHFEFTEVKPVRYHLSFQSRVGPVQWLRPYTDDKIRDLGNIQKVFFFLLLFYVCTSFKLYAFYVGVVICTGAQSGNSPSEFRE